MDLATEVYMNRANGCPCGETRIQLFRGANLTVDQEKRTHLLQYLKGSLEQKQKLRVLQSDLYAHFERIRDIKLCHSVKNIPIQYLFYLVCCMKSSCSHPVCKEESDNLPTWFNGSPSIAYLPLPIPNPEKLMEVTVISAKVIAMGIL